MLWCQAAQNIELSNHKLTFLYDHNARPSQMDEHHGNSATIRSDEHIAC